MPLYHGLEDLRLFPRILAGYRFPLLRTLHSEFLQEACKTEQRQLNTFHVSTALDISQTPKTEGRVLPEVIFRCCPAHPALQVKILRIMRHENIVQLKEAKHRREEEWETFAHPGRFENKQELSQPGLESLRVCAKLHATLLLEGTCVAGIHLLHLL